MFLSSAIETFTAIEPDAVATILLHLLLCTGIGFLFLKLFRRKKK